MAKIKCRGKVLSVKFHSGEIKHYVLIGNGWFYNGRKNLSLIESAPDGFWNDSFSKILGENNFSLTTTLKQIKASVGVASISVYTRVWEVKNEQ